MNESKISVRYSKALFETALEKGITDKVSSDMSLILEVCKTPEAREFLANPVIVPSRKSAVFHKLFGSEVAPVTMSLIDLVVKNGRESFLPRIALGFLDEMKRQKGITEATLTTAVKVETNIKNQVTKLVTEVFKTKVELKEVVDPSIIGGFVLKVEDSLIDASVKSKLRKVRKELLGSIKK